MNKMISSLVYICQLIYSAKLSCLNFFEVFAMIYFGNHNIDNLADGKRTCIMISLFIALVTLSKVKLSSWFF